MGACDLERLEDWLAGVLDASASAAVEAHVRGCDACRREVEWLRGEQAWMARRRGDQPAVRADLWDAVAARVETRKPRRLQVPALVVSSLAAAAAVVVFVATRPLGPVIKHAPVAAAAAVASTEPLAVLDAAEQEYLHALATLEAEYRRQRQGLPPAVAARYDGALERTRAAITQARNVSGRDVDARVQLLEGYDDYLWSLQSIVAELQVKQ
jgi:hypothetical protein